MTRLLQLPRAITRVAATLLAVLVAAFGVGAVGLPAQAATSSKYYTAAVSPAAVGGSFAHQSFTVTLTNCGPVTSGCTGPSKQSLASADIQLDAAFAGVSASVSAPGFFVVQPVTNGLVQLRSSSGALNPGQSIPVSVVADTPAGPAVYTWTTAVKQSNDFSGSGNNFILSGSQPQVAVGFPDHLAFASQPSDVQASILTTPAYMCPAPSVQVVRADGTPVTGGSAQISLAADTAFGDPGLGGVTTATATAGLATFGSACTSGVTASRVGLGYQLKASGTWTSGTYQVSLSTTHNSSAFAVVQVLTICQAGATCFGSSNGAHTAAAVLASAAPSTDTLELAVGLDSLAGSTCQANSQPRGIEVVRVVVDNRDKAVTLTFDKYLVNQVVNNGTPQMPVCFSAPWSGWVTALGTAPSQNLVTLEYEGLLPNCGVSGLAPGNPCISSRSRNAGNETVHVSIPFLAGRADPKMW